MALHSGILKFKNWATSQLISSVDRLSIKYNLETSSCGPCINLTTNGYSSSNNLRRSVIYLKCKLFTKKYIVQQNIFDIYLHYQKREIKKIDLLFHLLYTYLALN